MSDYSKYELIGTLSNVDYYLIDSDILLIAPPKGYIDNPKLARESTEFQNAWARKMGKKCGDIIIISDVLAQDAETRRIYREDATSGLYYGIALVVENALSRALASFLVSISNMNPPMKLFDSVEKAVDWLRTIRPV